jgi:hypothetical protein
MRARSASRPAPAPAPPLFTPFGVSSLSRVETTDGPPAPVEDGKPGAEAPDLDRLADYVLERLRDELLDGRERLGFLLDELR